MTSTTRACNSFKSLSNFSVVAAEAALAAALVAITEEAAGAAVLQLRIHKSHTWCGMERYLPEVVVDRNEQLSEDL